MGRELAGGRDVAAAAAAVDGDEATSAVKRRKTGG